MFDAGADQARPAALHGRSLLLVGVRDLIEAPRPADRGQSSATSRLGVAEARACASRRPARRCLPASSTGNRPRPSNVGSAASSWPTARQLGAGTTERRVSPWRGSFFWSPVSARSAGRSASNTPTASRASFRRCSPSARWSSASILLGIALKTLPVGTGYAVWTGIGAVGTAILGIYLFGESMAPAAPRLDRPDRRWHHRPEAHQLRTRPDQPTLSQPNLP